MCSMRKSHRAASFGKWCLKKNLEFSSVSTVLKVSVRQRDGNSVSTTVRLYGPNTEYVIDRQRELQVCYGISGEKDIFVNYFTKLAMTRMSETAHYGASLLKPYCV